MTVPGDSPRFIDSGAAALLLGVTTNNLRQIVREGKLRVDGKHGGRNMFSLDEVLELQTQRRGMGKPKS